MYYKIIIFFSTKVKWPFSNLKKPIEHNLSNVHNFYFEIDSNKLGVW